MHPQNTRGQDTRKWLNEILCLRNMGLVIVNFSVQTKNETLSNIVLHLKWEKNIVGMLKDYNMLFHSKCILQDKFCRMHYKYACRESDCLEICSVKLIDKKGSRFDERTESELYYKYGTLSKWSCS